MSQSSASPPTISPTLSPPVFRWLVLIGLLIAEVLVLTIRFDTGTLDEQTGWWITLFG